MCSPQERMHSGNYLFVSVVTKRQTTDLGDRGLVSGIAVVAIIPKPVAALGDGTGQLENECCRRKVTLRRAAGTHRPAVAALASEERNAREASVRIRHVTKFVAVWFNGDVIKRQVQVHGRNHVASFVVRRLFDGETSSGIVDVASQIHDICSEVTPGGVEGYGQRGATAEIVPLGASPPVSKCCDVYRGRTTLTRAEHDDLQDVVRASEEEREHDPLDDVLVDTRIDSGRSGTLN